MPAERLPMRKVREVLRQRYACGASERVIAQSLGIGRTAVGEYIRPRRGDRHHLADTGRARRHGAGAQAVRAGRLQPAAIEAAAGLGPCPCRAAPPRRDAGAAVAGLSRPASRRLRLQPLLRPLRRMAPRHHGDHAPDPRRPARSCSWTLPAIPCRCSTRSPGRCAPPRSSSRFMGASNYTFVQARFSEGAAGLDRRPCQCACLPGRGAEGDRLRQSQGRGHGGQPIRAGRQPDLPGPRRPLRHHHHAGAATQAARQGQGRGRRSRSSSAGSWRGCATGASSRSPS